MERGISKDLTLVLLRSNGAPRTFRIQIPTLRHGLFWITTLFAVLLVTSLIFSALYFYLRHQAKQQPKLTPAVQAKLDDYDSMKASLTKLQATAEGRTKVGASNQSADGIPLQLFGPLSEKVGRENSPVDIKDAKVAFNERKNQLELTFGLHNQRSENNPARGYILVLAKSSDSLTTYPAGAFQANDNILIDFRKGETFKISRFREATATFKDLRRENTTFQIVIFSFEGKILRTMHYDEKESSQT